MKKKDKNFIENFALAVALVMCLLLIIGNLLIEPRFPIHLNISLLAVALFSFFVHEKVD